VRGQPRFVLVVGAANADHVLDRRQVSAQLLDCAAELRPDKQQARPVDGEGQRRAIRARNAMTANSR